MPAATRPRTPRTRTGCSARSCGSTRASRSGTARAAAATRSRARTRSSHRNGADEIFSYGLRNPFRFSFDKRRIAIGDVGQDTREEVDYERLGTANGGNFGWDAFEGSKPFDSPDASPAPKHTIRPILDYTHAASGGCAITGGYVVRDHRIPSLYGRYVYSDFCAGQIRSLIPRTNGARDDRSAGLPNQSGISSFGVDAHRHLYLTNVSSGALSEVVPKG